MVTSFFFFLSPGSWRCSSAPSWPSRACSSSPTDVYNELFTMHGTLMLFLFVIPVLSGFANYVMPLHDRRARHGLPADQRAVVLDAPRWPAIMMLLRVPGGRRRGSRLDGLHAPVRGRPLARESARTSGSSALILIGTSSILGSINFIMTIFKMRAPGHDHVPACRSWSGPMLVTCLLVVLAIPVLASALILLFIDRNFGGSFFDPAHGGNTILWQHMFWFFSHPAVYIMILPAIGIDQRDPPGLQPQAAVRLQGVRVRDAGDRRPRLLRLGPPHVHDRRGLPAVLQLHDVPDRDARPGSRCSTGSRRCTRASSRSPRRCCSRSGS